MYAFASLLAPLICAEVFRERRDWRFGFLIFSVLSLAAFVVSLFAKNKPHAEETVTATHTGSLWNKYFWLVLMISFYSLTELALTTRLSLYLIRERGFTPENAANWLAYFFIGMLLGRLIFLLKHFHWATRNVISVCLVLTAMSLALGLALNPIFLVVCGVTIGPIFGLCMDFIAEEFKATEREAVSYCIAKSCLFIVTMHMVTGFLSDVIGLRGALAFGPFYLLIALFSIYKTKRVKAATASAVTSKS